MFLRFIRVQSVLRIARHVKHTTNVLKWRQQCSNFFVPSVCFVVNHCFMRTLIIGVDSGTQSTKALIVDANLGKVLGSGAQKYDLIPNLPPGAKEQHPHTWRDATAAAIRQALRQAKAVAAEVKAIGVSGQQHGFVPLDKHGEVIPVTTSRLTTG